MVKINLVTGIFGTSGYASHGRQLAEALIKLNPEIHLETNLIQGWELLVTDSLLKAIRQPQYKKSEGAVTIYIGVPNTWKRATGIPNNGFYPYLVWEGDKIPKTFIKEFADANKIFVPSKHVRDAILNTAEYPEVIKNFIEVVPHGVDLELFKPDPESKFPVFTFVANKGWAQGIHDRGGVQFLLKAYTDEFKKGEKVQLNLKINAAYFPQGWNLEQELQRLNLNPDRAAININPDSLEYSAMPKMYAGANVFVSPTMAEAFSIPCAEAMAMGIPVITTDWGGQTDFVNKFNGWLVPSKPVEVIHDWTYEGINWHMPDYAELRKAMRYAFEHPEECAQKGKQAREEIELYTWEASVKKVVEAIEKDLGMRKVLK